MIAKVLGYELINGKNGDSFIKLYLVDSEEIDSSHGSGNKVTTEFVLSNKCSSFKLSVGMSILITYSKGFDGKAIVSSVRQVDAK